VTPYVDFFHVRPALIYAVTTVLAVLSGGNMAALHVLSVLVAVAAVGAGGVPVHVGVRQEQQVLDDERVEADARCGRIRKRGRPPMLLDDSSRMGGVVVLWAIAR